MTRSIWLVRLLKAMLCLVPGSMMIGSGCAADLRDSMIAAGMDFVQEATFRLLETLIPVDQILPGSASA